MGLGGTGAPSIWGTEELRLSRGLRAENQQSWKLAIGVGLAGFRLGRQCQGLGAEAVEVEED